MMKHDLPLTLYDLSELTGVEPRTLRSWVADGLLVAPDKSGRGATYPGINLYRAQVVKAWKGYKSMSEISRLFLTASDDQIREWAAGRRPEEREDRGSALDYLAKITPRAGSAAMGRPTASRRDLLPSDQSQPPSPQSGRFGSNTNHDLFSERTLDDLTALERLVLQLEQFLNGTFQKRVRGETWTRMAVTRDLELSVRGNLDPDELAQFERLAGQLRTILTGRMNHE
jgi:DNA-binding transcriptional MerR regulator